MPLPDFSDLSGWAAFAALAGFVIALLLKGELQVKAVTDAQKARSDNLDNALKEVAPLVREIASTQKAHGIMLDFMSDFVRDTLRERSR